MHMKVINQNQLSCRDYIYVHGRDLKKGQERKDEYTKRQKDKRPAVDNNLYASASVGAVPPHAGNKMDGNESGRPPPKFCRHTTSFFLHFASYLAINILQLIPDRSLGLYFTVL